MSGRAKRARRGAPVEEDEGAAVDEHEEAVTSGAQRFASVRSTLEAASGACRGCSGQDVLADEVRLEDLRLMKVLLEKTLKRVSAAAAESEARAVASAAEADRGALSVGEGCGPFTSLPPDVLVNILHRLNVPDLLRLGAVSSSWRELTCRPEPYTAWIKQMPSRLAKQTELLLVLSQPRFQALTRLALPHGLKPGATLFSKLGKHLRCLEDLDMVDAKPKNVHMEDLAKNFSKLKRLVIGNPSCGFDAINRDWSPALCRVLRNNPMLEELQYQGNFHGQLIDDSVLRTLAASNPNLKRLHICEGHYGRDLGQTSLVAEVAADNRLACSHLSRGAFMELLSACPITHLSLSNINAGLEEGFEAAARDVRPGVAVKIGTHKYGGFPNWYSGY